MSFFWEDTFFNFSKHLKKFKAGILGGQDGISHKGTLLVLNK